MIRKNICLSISSYRSWVCLMCSAGRYICTLSLKEFILGQSQSDSLIIYNILLFYLLSAGNILAVKGLPPNEATYDFLVYGFSKCREVLSSVHYLLTMISKGLRPSSCSQGRRVMGVKYLIYILYISFKKFFNIYTLSFKNLILTPQIFHLSPKVKKIIFFLPINHFPPSLPPQKFLFLFYALGVTNSQ